MGFLSRDGGQGVRFLFIFEIYVRSQNSTCAEKHFFNLNRRVVQRRLFSAALKVNGVGALSQEADLLNARKKEQASLC